jgi:peptidyl-prolyl cis-trans isomerase C
MKVNYRIALLLACLGIAILAVWGCSKSDSQTVAQVGDYDISLKEFTNLTKNIRGNYATAQDEFNAKSKFLDSLINQRLLIQAAYDKNLDKADEVTTVVAQNKDKFLLDILYGREIEAKAKPTEADLKEFYNRRDTKYHVAHIMVSKKDTADMLIQKLKEGASFEQLAFDHSIDPNAKRSKGDMGFVTWGSLSNLPEIEEAAFKLQPGEVSPPVESRYGFHILKLIDKQPNTPRDSFEKMHASLERELTEIRRTRAALTYIQAMRKKYPVTVDKTTCDYLLKKREQLYPPELLATLPKNDFDDAQLDRSEKELVLATWEGGQEQVGDYLADSRKLPAAIRPNFDSYDSLAIMVFQIKITDILTYEASKAGVENDEEYKSKLKLFRELSMADLMKNDSSFKAAEPTEEEVRGFYDTHRENYMEPARVHVYEIQLSDEIQAGKLAKQLKSLDDFKKKATELSERAAKKASGGDLGYIQREWFPEAFDLAWKMSVGTVGGPVVAGGKYSILYLADKIDQQVTDYLGVKRPIADQITKEKSAAKYSQWISERRAATTIKVNTDVLWTTVDKTKYAATDSTAVKKN